MVAAGARRGRRRRLGLVAIFAAACLVYGFQAWHHRVPWLFEDEILYASQAREYAATGHLTVRGQPAAANRLTAIVTSYRLALRRSGEELPRREAPERRPHGRSLFPGVRPREARRRQALGALRRGRDRGHSAFVYAR
jgi:hypothetical protein